MWTAVVNACIYLCMWKGGWGVRAIWLWRRVLQACVHVCSHSIWMTSKQCANWAPGSSLESHLPSLFKASTREKTQTNKRGVIQKRNRLLICVSCTCVCVCLRFIVKRGKNTWNKEGKMGEKRMESNRERQSESQIKRHQEQISGWCRKKRLAQQPSTFSLLFIAYFSWCWHKRWTNCLYNRTEHRPESSSFICFVLCQRLLLVLPLTVLYMLKQKNQESTNTKIRKAQEKKKLMWRWKCHSINLQFYLKSHSHYLGFYSWQTFARSDKSALKNQLCVLKMLLFIFFISFLNGSLFWETVSKKNNRKPWERVKGEQRDKSPFQLTL